MVMDRWGQVPKQFAPEAKAGGVEINLQYGERSGDLKPTRQYNISLITYTKCSMPKSSLELSVPTQAL